MKFNICPIQPPGYVHAHAFDEVAALIAAGLADLGAQVAYQPNSIDPEARNIIIGCHLLDFNSVKIVPPGSIILNTEQLSPEIGSWNQNILNWLKNYTSWDYSKKNIENVAAAGLVAPKHLMLGFHQNLQIIPKTTICDVDVLFYGSMNQRRRDILDALIGRGLKVKELFGIYGAERDQWIARSKIVLNVHFFQTQIFEIVRCFYLMANGKAVVSEVGAETSIEPEYRQGICGASYDQLVDECVRLVKADNDRRDLERRALETMQSLPQARLMASLLS